MGDANRRDDWKPALRAISGRPYWPTDVASSPAATSFADLPKDTGAMDLCGTSISWCPVCHPQGCLAYKIEGPDSVIVIATDHEHSESDLSAGFLEFCRNADFLVYDAMYTPEEYSNRIGWGHGNWLQGVQVAMEASVSTLILTHHDMNRSDQQIEDIVTSARRFFPRTVAAMKNMVLSA